MRVRRRVSGCALFLVGTLGIGLVCTGVLAEVNPGNQRRDLIRVFGAVSLVVGVALVIPYLRGDGRSGQR
jgi:hypothetical protein